MSENISKLNYMITNWPDGKIHSLKWFKSIGITQQLAFSYFKNGWLEKLGPGIYIKKNDKVKWESALEVIQKELKLPFYAGGRTALQKLGHPHFIYSGAKPLIFLYSSKNSNLPRWFKKMDWKVEVQAIKSSLFEEKESLFHQKYPSGNIVILISSRERAYLELLDGLDLSFSFETARVYLESLVSLRPQVLQVLLERCNSIKVKRVFLYLAENLKMPWFNKLNLKKINLGQGKRVIFKGGILDKKYRITVPLNP